MFKVYQVVTFHQFRGPFESLTALIAYITKRLLSYFMRACLWVNSLYYPASNKLLFVI